MNTDTFHQVNAVSREIQEALVKLSDASQDYEKRRKTAQQQLTAAQGKLSMLISTIEPENWQQDASIMALQS